MSVWGRIARAIGVGRGDSLPVPPPAEMSAGTGWINLSTGMGTSKDPATATTYGFQMPLPDMLRDNLYEYEPTTGIVIDRPAKDLIRRGIAYKGFEGYDLPALQRSVRDKKVLARISRGYKWMRKDGGSLLVAIVNDGRRSYEPIDWSNLRFVHEFHVVERRQVSVAKWNYNPLTTGFHEPLLYYVHTSGPRSAMNLIHRDRVFRFVNGDLPYRSQQRFQGWGVSVIDRIWGPLRAKGAALAALSTILSSFAVDVVKINGYSKAIKLGEREYMQARADQMRATLGNLSKIFLDAEGEDFVPVLRSVAGIADIVELVIDEFQASTYIPKSILRGLTPGGLGDGENAGETRAYYDFMGGEQHDYLVPAATWAIDMIARSSWGPLLGQPPDDWTVEPLPLWTPTDLEKAQIRLTNAQARSTDWLTGNMSKETFESDPTYLENYDVDAIEGEETDELDDPERPFPPGHTPMNTRQAAEHFGVAPTTIRTMITSGKISAYNLNGRYVVSLQEVMQAAQRYKAKPAALPEGAGVAA